LLVSWRQNFRRSDSASTSGCCGCTASVFDNERHPELAEKCRALIWDLTAQVVWTGTSEVLDWNMWSRERRADTARRATELGVEATDRRLRVGEPVHARDGSSR